VFSDSYYHGIFWRTFWISALVTLICMVVGAPEAYVLSRMRNPWRSMLLLVVLAPLLVSVVVRAFGWSMLLGPEGAVNGPAGPAGHRPGEDPLHRTRPWSSRWCT
jgi:putative spermidine/putrescine transport system permease protein